MKNRGQRKSMPLTPKAKRVMLLLDQLWEGNRSAMARDLGISHSVINAVAYGQQTPGRKFLKALSADPRVNAIWLEDGTGEPFSGAGTATPTSMASLFPVAEHILPGSPTDYPAHLTSNLDLLSQAWFRPSRYLVRAAVDWPLLREPDARVAADDLLLVETSPIWLENPAMLLDGLIAVDTGPKGLHVVTSAALAKEMLPAPTERDHELEEFIRRFGKMPRGVQFDDEKNAADASQLSSQESPAWKIVGVILLVIRM